MSQGQKKRRRLPPEFTAPLMPCNVSAHRCPVSREAASRRILIMRVGAFGDILMGTPLLTALREAYPDAYLTWLVEYSQICAIDANPYIDEIIVWDSSYWKGMVRRALYPLWLFRALQFRRILRSRQYDVFISFQPEEWPLLVEGVGAPLSIGVFDTFRRYSGAKRTSPCKNFYTHSYCYPHIPDHRIDQYLLPLQALGLDAPGQKAMTMGYTRSDVDRVAHYLSGQGVSEDTPYLVLAPSTTWPSKCWPQERYAELGDELAVRHQRRIVLICNEKETETARRVASHMRYDPILATGNFNFREMAALLGRADLLVSGDTGPMHVAAAVGTPYVALFGPTDSHWYAPLFGQGRHLSHSVVCGPCDQKVCPIRGENHLLCQHLITVSEVCEAAAGLLAAYAPGV